MDTLNQLEYSQTMCKKTNENVIKVDIAFYHPNDDETIRVYDIEGMTEEFDNKLSNVIKNQS
jgi:myo-inositol catabolism protein IolC